VKHSNLQHIQMAGLTRKQRKLAKRHGTPAEFAVAVYQAVPGDLSMDEARRSIDKYNLQWKEAGRV
jgi:hypothetical protein